jgi:hypothetical protein
LPEAEPNDSRELAMQLPIDRPIAGSVSETDMDLFLLPAGVEPASLVLASESALELEVLRPQDAAGYILSKAVGQDLRIPRVARDASLFFTVRGTGEYTLLATNVDDGRVPCGFGHEPDDVFSAGAVMHSVPATATGCLTTPDDIDYFRLPAEAFADVPGFGLTLLPVTGVSLRVVVKDENGLVLAEMNGNAGDSVEFPNMRVPASGGILFEIRSQAGANETEAYQLNLSRLPALSGTIELEPNDEPTAPTLLNQIGLVNGYIHRPGDEDHYVLSSDEPRLVRLFAEAPSGIDLRVEVQSDQFGQLVINNAGAGEAERLCSMTITEEGTPFMVSAGNFQSTEREPYLLHFEFIEGPNWEIEPNNTVDQVLDLERQLEAVEGGPDVALWLGDSVVPYAQGYAFPPGDQDRYVVEVFGDPLAAVTYKSVTIRLEPSAPADYSLELVDEQGATVGIANDGGVGEAESLALDLPSGLYVARVTYVDGEPCERPYRISVGQTDIPVNAVVVEMPELARDIIPTQVLGNENRSGTNSGEGGADGSGDDGAGRIDPNRLRPRIRPQIELRPDLPPPPTPRVPIGESPTPVRSTPPPTFGGGSGR